MDSYWLTTHADKESLTVRLRHLSLLNALYVYLDSILKTASVPETILSALDTKKLTTMKLARHVSKDISCQADNASSKRSDAFIAETDASHAPDLSSSLVRIHHVSFLVAELIAKTDAENAMHLSGLQITLV